MRFLSIYRTPERTAPPTPEDMARMNAYIESSMKRGVVVAVEGCLPTRLGAQVRQGGGKVIVTDGPFAEAKEVIAGLAILEAESKEAAIALAREFLGVAGDGECEVRQLYEAPAA